MAEQNTRETKIQAVILAGSRDFGRCPVASRLPLSLWPVAGKTVLERLLHYLHRQGITQVRIFSNGDRDILRSSVRSPADMAVRFVGEHFPFGTAGCIRDAAKEDRDSLILVLHANMISPPDITEMVAAHREGNYELTVALNPLSERDRGTEEAAGIYLCNPTIVEYIPELGYCDIKETLVPKILQHGKTVHGFRLGRWTGNFNDWIRYLEGVFQYLEAVTGRAEAVTRPGFRSGPNAWIDSAARIAPSAGIYGPVIIQQGVEVAEDAVVFGPAILGREVIVGPGSLVTDSVLWDNAKVGRGSVIQGCLMDTSAIVPDHTIFEDELIAAGANGRIRNSLDKINGDKNHRIRLRQPLIHRTNKEYPQRLPAALPARRPVKELLDGVRAMGRSLRIYGLAGWRSRSYGQ